MLVSSNLYRWLISTKQPAWVQTSLNKFFFLLFLPGFYTSSPAHTFSLALVFKTLSHFFNLSNWSRFSVYFFTELNSSIIHSFDVPIWIYVNVKKDDQVNAVLKWNSARNLVTSLENQVLFLTKPQCVMKHSKMSYTLRVSLARI